MRLTAALTLCCCLAACGRDAPVPPTSPPAPAPTQAEPRLSVVFAEPAIPAAPDRSSAHPGPNDSVKLDRFGYTTAEIERRLHVTFGRRPGPSGEVLLNVESVDVAFKMNLHLAVSSQLTPGGCPDRVVWEHELGHARDFAAVYGATESNVRAAVDQALSAPDLPGAAHPRQVQAGEVDVVQRELQARLSGVIEKQVAEAKTMMDARRQERDSAPSMSQDEAKCPAADWPASR